MAFNGVLVKMLTEHLDVVQYYLEMDSDFIHMNQLINKTITISLEGYQCLNCNDDRDIFAQGYCKSCFFRTPLTAEWVMKPELSKAHLDIEDRDLTYEKSVQLEPHIVYLANSSEVKVGVTRKSQVPTRWIDQGAHEALEIVEVPNRYLAGITEVALKEQISDKTNWRKMLLNVVEDVDLKVWRDKLKPFIPEEIKPYFIEHNSETHINFPVQKYPVKINSLNLKKDPNYTGKLVGIKGQYLIFEDGIVFNVRSHEGYVVKLSVL